MHSADSIAADDVHTKLVAVEAVVCIVIYITFFMMIMFTENTHCA